MGSTLSPSSRPVTSQPSSSASLRASLTSSKSVDISAPCRCSQKTHTPLYSLKSAIVILLLSSDQMLAGQDRSELRRLVAASEHGACTLLGRSKGLKDVGGRALQADGVHLDKGIILQRVVIKDF